MDTWKINQVTNSVGSVQELLIERLQRKGLIKPLSDILTRICKECRLSPQTQIESPVHDEREELLNVVAYLVDKCWTKAASEMKPTHARFLTAGGKSTNPEISKTLGNEDDSRGLEYNSQDEERVSDASLNRRIKNFIQGSNRFEPLASPQGSQATKIKESLNSGKIAKFIKKTGHHQMAKSMSNMALPDSSHENRYPHQTSYSDMYKKRKQGPEGERIDSRDGVRSLARTSTSKFYIPGLTSEFAYTQGSAVSFPKDNRFRDADNGVPSVHQYRPERSLENLRKSSSPNRTFDKAKKKTWFEEIVQKNCSPGPKYYGSKHFTTK